MNRVLIFLVGVAAGAAIMTGIRLLGVEETAIERRAGPPRNETPEFATPPRDEEPPRPAQPITGVVPARDAPSTAAPAPARESADLPVAGAITGSVRRPDGTPAEGVLVRAIAMPGNKPSRWDPYRRGDGPPPDASMDALTEEFLKGVAAERASRREAISDEAGKYALTELGTGRYYMRAWLPGHDVDPTKSTSSVRAGAIIDFVARPVVRVPVNVLLPDGGQPEVAYIQITTGRGGNSETWRPEWGEIRCLPGSWSMSATGGDERQYRSEAQDVVVKADAAPEPIVFQLKESPGIKGRLLGVPAESFSELRIFALRYVGDPPDDARVIDQGRRDVPHGTADCDFALSDLEEGRYVIGVAWGDRFSSDTDKKLAARVSVDVKGLVRQDLTVPPDDSKGIILWVLGPNGAPQQDADLSITIFAGPNSSSTNSARASKRADGSLRLAMPSAKSRDRKDLLTVQSQRFGAKRVEVDWDREQTLTVRFEEPATLAVTIPNYAGSRHQGAVSLMLMAEDQKSSRGSSHMYSGARISPEGRQTFSGVQPGSYELVLTVGQVRAAALPVTLVAGPNSATVSIPPLFRVTVAAGEEHRGGNVFTQAGKPEGRGLHASIGDDGQAVFETVLPGDYVFSLSSPKGFGKTRSLTIAADAVVRFEPGEIKPRGESPR